MRLKLKTALMLVVAAGILLPTLSDVAVAQPRVNVMPGNQPGQVYKIIWPGQQMIVWGNVNGGATPYAYQWDFGDGTAPVSGAVSNPKYIAVNHTYATQGPKLAVLTVTDGNGDSEADTVEIEVAPRTSEVEINAAIENGLRWLYLQQTTGGYWNENNGYPTAATATAVLAFENQGHLPTNDINKDIYAEYVQAGLNYINTRLAAVAVPAQAHGDPEEVVPGNADVNGIGLMPNSGRSTYEVGMVMMALVASRAPDRIATTGPANVIGRSYRDIVIDLVDFCAWSQTDANWGRGGWRYSPNSGDADNSVSQWPTIGLEAAESDWGIEAPGFVKSEMLYWIAASQYSGGYWDGAFPYTPGSFSYSGMATSGAGICELGYVGISKNDTRYVRALDFFARQWNTVGGNNFGYYYGMYAIAKGFRTAVDDADNVSEVTCLGAGCGINWYNDYATWLVTHQNASGQWTSGWWSYMTDHCFALLILQRTLFGGSPVAVIKAPPSAPPSIPIPMDGSFSYHQDPVNHKIVSWLWDFDASDGVDWANPDDSGDIITNPGYPLADGIEADTFVVTLRVVDDNDPYKAAEVTHIVVVDRNNHPPTAVAGGPYAAKVGEPITFDGTGSYDPDAGDHIESYSWDLNGDGVFGDCTDPICERTWNEDYRGYISLIVTDGFGAQSWDTSSVRVWTSRVDVSVAPEDIAFSVPQPQPGNNIQIEATIRCDATSNPVQGVQVRFFDGDPSVPTNQIGATQTILAMTAGDAVSVSVDYVVPLTLPRTINVVVDPENLIEEFDEGNNLASKQILAGPTEGLIFGKVTAGAVNLQGVVLYLVVGSNTVDSVITDADGKYEFGELADGDYVVDLQAPLGMSPVGESVVPVTVQGEPVELNFELKNVATGKVCDLWWWKEQLLAIKEGRKLYNGLTKEMVDGYGQLIYDHFYSRSDGFAIRILWVSYASEDAQDAAARISTYDRALTFEDIYWIFFKEYDESYKAKAERSLLVSLLNVVSARQGQLAIVTADGATASQAITYFAGLYVAGGSDNLYAAYINLKKMYMKQIIPAGIVPLSTPNIMYKPGEKVIPDGYALAQNFPNPFNPMTTISFSLPVASEYSLTIYNMAGQVVAEITGAADAGVVSIKWDGSAFSSGVYLYRLSAGSFTDSRKMMLLK
ncbi:hypothetical protein C3F09_12335 [candidate division GN15 bacterium]|uniref:PKD domain-containing protein n=1 Tax=candidate division GN15 bacterium TaxID=2072418 RepID=A0A855X3A1_9BACT|nr:MAG: hypothetical protein C3F09_12335 [candidate division GN15 bacterium]